MMPDVLIDYLQPEADVVAALDTLPYGIIIADTRGVIMYYNQLQSEMDGVDKEDAIGHHVTELYVPSPDSSPIMTVITTGEPLYDLFEMYETRNGKVVNSSHTVLPLVRKGQIRGCICFIKQLNFTQKPKENGISARDAILFRNLVGSSPEFRASVNAALSAADTPSSVLICGETGSGKELLARQLHEQSKRAGKPYVTINCTAIPATLLEGMLFGSVKGAFTGALNKAGLFEEAHGGTIYLDEVDSMPLELQPKLLRVIQERKVRRVGESRELAVDLKIISSFSGDPLDAVRNGRVRADLFYRLGVVIVNIPPLRERISDLPGLISFFINKHQAKLKKRINGVRPEVMAEFKNYQWPGNVRELENIIESSLNFTRDGETVGLEHLPYYFRRALPSACDPPNPARLKPPPPRPELYRSLRQEESYGPTETESPRNRSPKIGRREIIAAMTSSRGSIKEAAEFLGISRQLLSYRLKKYGLSRQQFDD